MLATMPQGLPPQPMDFCDEPYKSTTDLVGPFSDKSSNETITAIEIVALY